MISFFRPSSFSSNRLSGKNQQRRMILKFLNITKKNDNIHNDDDKEIKQVLHCLLIFHTVIDLLGKTF